MNTDYAAWRGELAKGMDPRLYTIGYLDRRIADGSAAPIIGERSIIVVELKSFPAGATAIAGLIAAGDAKEIETVLIPRAEEWGRSMGCAFGMIESRAGWQRVMKKHGYEPFQISLIKEL